jgi:NADH-quinone oxidoreductase subunit M
MILAWLIIVLLLGGLSAWAASFWNALWSRLVSLLALAIDVVLLVAAIASSPTKTISSSAGQANTNQWLLDFSHDWIPQFGVSLHLALDGLSLLLVALTLLLGFMAVLCSWTEIKERVGFFHFNLLWILSGIIGVFLALDLFLFYFFWELMLVPMYFLIGIWGHENRTYAAIKFFLFTQASGLLMLIAIVGLYFIHGRATGVYTFDYLQLIGTSMSPAVAMWLMLGFLVALAVKLPVVPFHTWLPDAHTEAPTAGSVILAGLLLKTGAYGLLRFVVPLFPDAARAFTPIAMVLAVVGIFYGAILAFAQTDLKRLVAYTSISHMGFVLLGVFALNEIALQGAVIQILCHGLSTGALFILVGALDERLHTRDLNRMGGLWAIAPRMGAVTMVFVMASLGLPGLGNFVGEFLVLFGTYRVNIPLTILAAVGIVFATIYSLWIIQRAFHGPVKEGLKLRDLSPREIGISAVMIAALVGLGIAPQPALNTARSSIESALGQSSKSQRAKDKGESTAAERRNVYNR